MTNDKLMTYYYLPTEYLSFVLSHLSFVSLVANLFYWWKNKEKFIDFGILQCKCDADDDHILMMTELFNKVCSMHEYLAEKSID